MESPNAEDFDVRSTGDDDDFFDLNFDDSYEWMQTDLINIWKVKWTSNKLKALYPAMFKDAYRSV